jgi:hypothetical protein
LRKLGQLVKINGRGAIVSAPGGRALALRINRKMLVLKMLGHGFGLFGLDLFGRGIE